jgi:hypothetical protein
MKLSHSLSITSKSFQRQSDDEARDNADKRMLAAVAYKRRCSQIILQYNPNHNANNFNEKKEVRAAISRHNVRHEWRVIQSPEAILDILDQGFTIQFGVNLVSSNKKDVSFLDGFFLDYDPWDKNNNAPVKNVLSLQELVNIPLIRDNFYAYQKSFSHRSDECPSMHFYFFFDRSVSLIEHELIGKAFFKKCNEQINQDPSLHREGLDFSVANNSAQLCFGSPHQTVLGLSLIHI